MINVNSLLFNLVAIVLLTQFTAPAHANPESNAEADSIPRISLEAGAGSLLLYFQGRAAYRLPVLEDRIDVFAGYSFIEAGFIGSSSNAVTMGGRYYLMTDGWFQPYGLAGLGLWMTRSTGVNSPAEQPLPAPTYDPMGNLGLGADFMLNPYIGLNTQVAALFGYRDDQFGILPRVELNLKVKF